MTLSQRNWGACICGKEDVRWRCREFCTREFRFEVRPQFDATLWSHEVREELDNVSPERMEQGVVA